MLWLMAPPLLPPGTAWSPHPGSSPSRPEALLGSANSLPGLEVHCWMPVPAPLHHLLESPSAERGTEKGQGHCLADGVTRQCHLGYRGSEPKGGCPGLLLHHAGWWMAPPAFSKKRRWEPLQGVRSGQGSLGRNPTQCQKRGPKSPQKLPDWFLSPFLPSHHPPRKNSEKTSIRQGEGSQELEEGWRVRPVVIIY